VNRDDPSRSDTKQPPAGAAPAREGQTFGGASPWARYASFVKLPHTLFALPFAGVGVILAAAAHPGRLDPAHVFWIVVAFSAARFAAMGFNRIADRHFDARNPRTAGRELPVGRLTVRQAAGAVAVAAAIFLVAAWRLNPLVGWLAPLALAWVLFYSYTKRFTAWSHAVLGFGLAMAPVGAYLAVAGSWPSPWWAPLLLAAAVLTWVAGFDIVYALQDIDVDRREGLHSVPARFGVRRARLIARFSHFAAVALFLAIWASAAFPVGAFYLTGVFVMAAVLHVEHTLLGAADDTAPTPARIDRAFFLANAGVAASFFAFVLLDWLVLG
jgi:4-hydroxybenzoate polyprenyltransferase